MDARAIEELIYKKSGLLGISGKSSDMRTLLEKQGTRARLAIDLFLYRIRREMGRSLRPLAELMRLSSQAGSAKTLRQSVSASAAMLHGSAWNLTQMRTHKEVPASALQHPELLRG